MCQIGLWGALLIWPELHDPYYGYKATRLLRRTLGSEERPFTALMIGSSRTAFGLQGGRLEDRLARELGQPVVAFNFGVPGAGPVMQLLHYRRLRAAGLRPDLLLIEVLPPLLDGKRGAPWEQHWLLPSRLRRNELSLVQRFGFPAEQTRREWLEALLLPSFAYRYSVVTRVAPQWVPWSLRQDWGRDDDAMGSTAPLRDVAPAHYEKAVARAWLDYSPYLKDFQLGGPECAALCELLERCTAERIPTMLVLLPEGPTFRSWYSPAAREQIQGFIASVSQRYGLPVVDAREWIEEGQFLDSHHLLRDGAARFTDGLIEQVVRFAHETSATRKANAGRPKR
jgi:hypothetical protein